jgi:hypothetical protein
MVKQQVQKAAVAARVAVAFDEGHELIDFGGSEVFAVVLHFVQCLRRWTARNARNGVRGVPRHETFGRLLSSSGQPPASVWHNYAMIARRVIAPAVSSGSPWAVT